MLRAVWLCWFALAWLAPVRAYEFWPGASYDPRIPTVYQVLGYGAGERITSHAGALRYLEALAAASPDIKIFEYGVSWEGRKLVYAAIGSEANIKRLAAIRSDFARFADPRKTSEAEARRLMAGLPAVVWLAAGVHGDEVSSTEALLLAAYHLLAERNDKMVEAILANDVVLIDPLQNPDGHERFLNYYEETAGAEPDASPAAAEHNQPWPGGRYNHYLFDLNRDWIALTQPETRGEVKVLRDWLPLVAVDLHEMSGDSTYFFSPEADPYNPNLTAAQKKNLKLFGRNNARWFDKFGFDYFTREVYDAFYPGYGASWPSYYGALAMTYEQASSRGLVLRRSDDSELTFRDTVRHHFVAALSTLETAAWNRGKLLEDFYRYRASAVREGRAELVREYILPRSGDPSATDRLAEVLSDQGVEVRRAAGSFRSGGREYEVGTYVIDLAQPGKRLIRTLLDRETAMDEPFLAAEATRRQMKEHSEIFDVTAWSLPLLFNVEAMASDSPPEGKFEMLAPGRAAGRLHDSPQAVAYLVPWGTQAAGRLLAAALRQNLRVFSSDRAFRQDTRAYPAGTLIFKTGQNPANLSRILDRLARESGADIYGTDTGWVEDGVNFGSRYVMPVRKPAIALAWDSPVATSAAGAARFVLERQFGYPVTLVRTAQIGSADLSKFNVLILPPGDYLSVLDDDEIDRVKQWVTGGGTLIAIGDAIDFVSDSKVELLHTAREDELPPAEVKSEKKSGPVPATEIANDAQYQQAMRAASEAPDGAPGAIVRARIRADHWLTAGVSETLYAMFTGHTIYSPLKADLGVNAVYFDALEAVLVSGLLSDELRRQIAYKPLVLTEEAGRGVVIGFTADPNFRGMADGMNVLFLNAVFRGPAHAKSAASE